MGDERERLSTRIGMLLRMNRRVRDAALEPRNLSPMLPPLQRWQAARLARGFDDLLADPRSAPAARFFLSDLYGDHDVSGRDRDVERVMPLMQRLLPAEMLGIAADAMELAVLSHALDLRTAAALEEHGAAAEADITEQGYAQAYRSVGRARLRVRQVGLIRLVGGGLAQVVHTPTVAQLLRLARLPARMAGLTHLQSFLERGFGSFGKLPDAAAFVDTIVARERRVMQRLFESHPRPFAAAGEQSRG